MRTLIVTLALATLAAAGEPKSAVLEDYGGLELKTSTTAPARTDPVRTNSSAEVASSRKKGVTWLREAQHRDGGWSSGVHGTDGNGAQSDVATTAFVVLALMRDGASPTDRDLARGIENVVAAVETAPKEGPRLNTPEGTQIQYKLGPLVDTHMAGLMLGEVVGRLDGDLDRRARAALQTVVKKIERAQDANGSFESSGWAPVLSSGIASQGLYRAQELGLDVDERVITKNEEFQQSNVSKDGTVDASEGAGVALYAVASTLSGSRKAAGRPSASPAERERAEQVAGAAQSIVSRDDGRLVAGFGSIGGEEMLSYMMISDSLAAEGGKEWQDWDAKIGSYLGSIQNADGSWIGHHCITSQAFTTAGAIMTLAAGDHHNRRARG